MFFKPPCLLVAGPSGRYFLSREASCDTLDSIPSCDGIRSENTDQTTAEICKPVAARFGRDKRPTSGSNSREQRAQGRILKVVQKQSSDAQIVALRVSSLRPDESIFTHYVHSPLKAMKTIEGIKIDRRVAVK